MTDTHDPVPVSEARAAIAALVGRAQHAGERTVITKHGRAVAAIVSTTDLDRLLALEAPADSAHVVRVEVTVPGDPSGPWMALVSRVRRDRWWPGVQLFDEVGGSLRTERGDVPVDGDVLEMAEDRRLVLTWREPGWPATTRVSLDLVSGADGTTVRLTHTGFEVLPGGVEIAETYRTFWRGRLAALSGALTSTTAGSSSA